MNNTSETVRCNQPQSSMIDWKTKLIQAYRYASIPLRKLWLYQMTRKGTVPCMVLFYHRVADDHPNPWTISRADFEQQIDWFQENFDLVDLEECQRRIQSGSNSRPTLSITFDDGYAENCEFALPLLIERRIPVTYFVTTQHTTLQRPFPHDLERDQPLPVNTIASLLAMDIAGVEIGAHTRTHVDIGQVKDQEELMDEVIASSVELESIIGRRIRYFAFPFGQPENLCRNTFAMLKEAGFLGVCSAYGGWNEVGQDAFHIQRIHGDPNFQRMKNWLTFDPRIGRVARFDYHGGTFDPELLRKTINAAISREGFPPDTSQHDELFTGSSIFPSVDGVAPDPTSFTPSN